MKQSDHKFPPMEFSNIIKYFPSVLLLYISHLKTGSNGIPNFKVKYTLAQA